MKAFTVLATAALLVAINTDSAAAKPGFLEKIPNAEAAGGKSLGHTDSELSAFGKEFKKANFDWAKVCSQPFPGADMTAGEALGDPCCEWKSGAAPQKIDAFVSGKPVKKTTCSKNNPTTAPSPTQGPAPSPNTPTSPTMTPSPATPMPGKPTTSPSNPSTPMPGKPTTSPSNPSTPMPGKPTTSPSSPSTPAPGPKPSAKPSLRPGSKCKAQREQKSLDDDSEDDQ
ncbi:hypothetical protein P43SY_004383 [Pythium insidiosum]|uniref:Temptin Cys/Cys disulfide domain-containing protein n=1 Tax=Pythium insidiosum TaxID=114742 RepID=A0AAD5LRR6_PYTIN|nr:hypothetical protein P43SY_004383 [Pythium insidiosum]